MKRRMDQANAETELRRLLGATAAHVFDVSVRHGIVTVQMDPTDAAVVASLAFTTLKERRQ